MASCNSDSDASLDNKNDAIDIFKAAVREEITQELEKKHSLDSEEKMKQLFGEALWAVHDLKAIVDIPVDYTKEKFTKDVALLIPGLKAKVQFTSGWAGFEFPDEAIPALNGNFEWTTKLYHKDGTVSKAHYKGTFNFGNYFVNTDRKVSTWGTNFDQIKEGQITR